MEQREFFERFFEGTMSNYRVDDPIVLSPEEASALASKHKIFNNLTSFLTLKQAFDSSNREREEWSIMHDITLTYGEAVRPMQDFLSIGEILLTVVNRYSGCFDGGIFYDLGSVRSK